MGATGYSVKRSRVNGGPYVVIATPSGTKIVSAPGAASSGGTVGNKADNWSGAIATFKAASTTTLALSGSTATNHTVTSATGSVIIIANPLTITAA